MDESSNNAVTMAGGKKVPVIGKNGDKAEVFVRQLPIGDLSELAVAIGGNNGLGDDEQILLLYVGPEVNTSLLDDASIDRIHEEGDSLNLPFLSRMLARSQRRNKALAGIMNGAGSPSAISSPKSPGSPA